MSEQNKLAAWVWVVVEKAGNKETLLALKDEARNLSFIPVFQTKEDGLVGRRGLKKDPEVEHELEAMSLAEAARYARDNHLEIFILDHAGKVLERLAPLPDA